MTTNGFLFAQKAHALRAAGLRRVSFSLDSLDRGNFKKMTGRDGLLRSTPKRPLYANGGGPAPWMLETLPVTLTYSGARLAARRHTIDESAESLGSSLSLPPWFNVRRDRLDVTLPPIVVPTTATTGAEH